MGRAKRNSATGGQRLNLTYKQKSEGRKRGTGAPYDCFAKETTLKRDAGRMKGKIGDKRKRGSKIFINTQVGMNYQGGKRIQPWRWGK